MQRGEVHTRVKNNFRTSFDYIFQIDWFDIKKFVEFFKIDNLYDTRKLINIQI